MVQCLVVNVHEVGLMVQRAGGLVVLMKSDGQEEIWKLCQGLIGLRVLVARFFFYALEVPNFQIMARYTTSLAILVQSEF